MMIFKITYKTKRKARRKRQRGEKNWRWWRWGTRGLLLAFILFFTVGIFGDVPLEFEFIFALGTSCSLIGIVVCMALLTNFTSSEIQDRLNEKIWIENEKMYHVIQRQIAAGYNYRTSDEVANLYVYDLSTIRDAKYDERSGRIEFCGDCRFIHYENFSRGIIGEDRLMNGKKAVFYGYMEPNIYEFLRDRGIKFSVGRLDYKFRIGIGWRD